MGGSAIRKLGVTAAAVAVLAVATGCQGDEAGPKKAERTGGSSQGAERSAAKALTAAYEKTADAESAEVEMTVKMPPGLAAGAGDLRLSGVMGWNPTAMDMTVANAPTGGDTRMIRRDDALYMDLGDMAATGFLQGATDKRWVTIDLGASAGKSGDAGLGKQLTAGLENAAQDPAEQLALLLEAPGVEHVGSDTVDGKKAEHYRGTVAVDDLLKADGSLDALPEKDRDELLKNLEKSGVERYETEAWVGSDDYPVRMDVGTTTSQGTVEVSAKYSDYGTKTDIEAPPAGETTELAELLEGIGLGG